jgi:hypothetical protein
MEPISDEEIRRLWAEHFQKYKQDAESERCCLQLVLLIVKKAQSAPLSGDWLRKLEKKLKRLGVPKAEFDQVLADTGIAEC